MDDKERQEKFTPGPWRVRRIAEFDIYKNASLFVLANDDGIIKMGRDAKEVASMPNLHRHPDEVETIYANAHLIAAAPKMYCLQMETVDTLRRICRNLNLDDNIRKQLEPLIYKGEIIGKEARGEYC